MAHDHLSMVAPRQWAPADVSVLVRALCRTASAEQNRTALRGIHIENGAACATDGMRLLCVLGIANEALNGHTIAVEDRRMLPVLRAGKYPVDFEQLNLSDPTKHTYQYEVRDFLRLRKKRHDQPVSIVKGELAIGSNKDALRIFNLRYLAELPATDDSLIVSFNTTSMEEPIVVRPHDGGWFGLLMGQTASRPTFTQVDRGAA